MGKKVKTSDLGPVPWQDFVVGFQVASEALELDDLEQMPDPGVSDATDAQRRQAAKKLKEDPYLRVMIAVRNHFGADYPQLTRFMLRFWSLMDLLRRGHLNDWVTLDEATNFQSFHPAVLLAAAEVKLSNKAKFPPNRFTARVLAIIEEEAGEDGQE